MTRNVFIDHKRRVCFFWSPKCASRSLSGWLAEIYIQPGKANAAFDRAIARTFQYDFATGAMLAMQQGYLAVAVVRHPARRIASAFINKFVTARGKPLLAPEDLEDFALQTVHAIQASRGESETPYRGIRFLDLLDHVEERIGQAKDGRDADLNPHWNAQILPYFADLGLTFDHVCAVETLAEDFAPVKALYGDKGTVAERNASPYAADDEPEDLSATSSVELAQRAFPLDALLSPDVLTRIATLYARDYAVLGYDPMDTTSLPALRRNNGQALRQRVLKATAHEWLTAKLAGGGLFARPRRNVLQRLRGRR